MTPISSILRVSFHLLWTSFAFLCTITTCLVSASAHYIYTFISPFQVGDRDDSNLYISMKLKAAARVGWDSIIQSYLFVNIILIFIPLSHSLSAFFQIGINANHIRLPKTATEDEVSGNNFVAVLHF